MKKQVFNPYLPSWEYIPDGEPYVFGHRVYVYGSHDKFNGEDFCMNDYVCWSAPEENLTDWRYEGVIYRREQDPRGKEPNSYLFAPDVQKGPDGRYYLYYALSGQGGMAVAVCDTPAGEYQFYGYVHRPDGSIIGDGEGDVHNFDPGIFMDDDGRIFLFTGFGPYIENDEADMERWKPYGGGFCMELEQDMLTAKNEPKLLFPRKGHAEGTGFEGHEFYEASSMRKINGKYYFIYSSINSHELCYAISDYPDKDFKYGGTLVSNGDIFLNGRKRENALNYIGNTHGSLVEIQGQWYIFYHRQTNRHYYSRQGCAEKIILTPEGKFLQAEITSCGLNDGPLNGKGHYDAYIACNLMGKNGTGEYRNEKADFEGHPYFTQEGEEREDNPDSYIADVTDGTKIGYKYFDLRDTHGISVEVRGTAKGHFLVKDSLEGEQKIYAEVPVEINGVYRDFFADFVPGTEKSALYFVFEGEGKLDFRGFELD